MTPISPAPKPERALPAKRKWSSIPEKSYAQKLELLNRKRSRSGPKGIPKKKAKKRDRNDSARIYGPKAFVTFLHAHECLGCGYQGHAIQQAHLKTGGMGRKGSWKDTGPLCGPHTVRFWNSPNRTMESLVEGCHARHDRAKRSWRTSAGETFTEAQRKFFAEWLKVVGNDA